MGLNGSYPGVTMSRPDLERLLFAWLSAMSFAIIAFSSHSLSLTNYAIKEWTGRSAIELNIENERFSRCHLANYVKEFYLSACRTCSTILFPHLTNQIIFLWRCLCCYRCLYLNSQMVSIFSMNGGRVNHRTILSSGDHLSSLPKAAEREMLTALTARREALMEKLMEKTLELKKLCIEEAVSSVKHVALRIHITEVNERTVLDKVFVISRIINTTHIITKPESYNCFIIHWTKKKRSRQGVELIIYF